MMIVPSALGPLEITWSARAITAIRLRDGTTARPKRARGAERPPAFVREAIAALNEHLASGKRSLADIPLDMSSLPAFHARVYAASRAIPPGKTIAYGELAAKVGSPGAARAVGQAMARNPFMIVVPCHRVVASASLGGFSAPGGSKTKRRLLELEGVVIGGVRLERAAPRPLDHERAMRELRRADPTLRVLIDRIERAGAPRLQVRPIADLFEALGRSIVYQQLSGKAAAAIHRKYAALFPRNKPSAVHLARLSDAAVRGAGLSAAKLMALRDLAAKVNAREVPSLRRLGAMSDDEITESLTRIRGIGPWTVHMLLIFRLGRPDVLPTGDYGVRKGFAKVYGKRKLPDAHTLEKHAERWRPWRSVASWYMWRALE